MLDSQALAYLTKHAPEIWPNDQLDDEQIRAKFKGLADEQVWHPKKKEEKKEEDSKFTDLLVDGATGTITKVECPFKEAAKKANDDFVEKEPQEKKAKLSYEPADDYVGGEDGCVRRFPAEYVVFPLQKNKKFECKAVGIDGLPRKVGDLKEDMEISSTSIVRFGIEDGIAKMSLTAIHLEVAQLDLPSVCKPARSMYVPQ